MNAGQSSKTAKLVARSMMLASHDTRLGRLLPENSSEILNSIPAVSRGGFGVLRRFKFFRQLCKLVERVALPGISTHYLVRKAWIEREVRSALASGVGRVVVIGAGFDTLASRLAPEYPEVNFFELDHPATQREKANSFVLRENIHLLPVDLERETLLDAIRENALAPEPAIVIAEGLTMYLAEEQVTTLLRDAASLAGQEGRVLFSFMEKREDGSLGFQGQSPWVRRWLDACGESFRWGIECSRLASFLAECGLTPAATAGCEDFRQGILNPNGLQTLRLARGEWLCLANPERP